MGSGTISSGDFDAYRNRRHINASSTVDNIFVDTATGKKRRTLKAELNPNNIKIRESRDSTEHPNSRAIIFGVDVTGSMGKLSEEIAKMALEKITKEIFDKKPVQDPQIAFFAIGDANTDDAPLQMTQFESDIRMAEQFADIYFEGGGGGNGGETYSSAWYAASRKTSIDCFEKRNQKGFLFTMGDECNLKELTKANIAKIFGDNAEANLSDEELLTEVSRKYEVFHLIVGTHSSQDREGYWKKILGERALSVKDISKIPEIIVSTLQIVGGADTKDVIAQWNGDTAIAVREAVGGLTNVKTEDQLVDFVA